MFRKLIMSLAPVLAVIAFAVIPAVAQALPQWEHCVKGTGTVEFKDSTCKTKAAGGGWIWQVIPATTSTSQTKEQVKTHGKLTLNVAVPAQKIVCTLRDKGVIWNEGGVGKDEITEFVNTSCVGEPKCSPVAVVAEGLPWHSTLLAGPPIRDEVTGVTVNVNCNVVIGIFSGTLTPAINETNGTAEFGEGSGELTTKGGVVGVVEGTDGVEQEDGAAIRP